mmetsp:Transcript_19041/g.19037  ORF Transcript_19041/g.19037 Transcript_19041/m.19037 type:complete len:174 (+) Transcript_19041:42-563(+)
MSFAKKNSTPRTSSSPRNPATPRGSQAIYQSYANLITPRTQASSDPQEIESLRKEVNYLKNGLNEANKIIKQLKAQHEEEIRTLKFVYDEMKKELESAKSTKPEESTRPSQGIEEYTQLAQELIRLRTDVDRLSSAFVREKRASAAQRLESLLHERTQQRSFASSKSAFTDKV